MDTLKPRTAKDVEDAVQSALSRSAALELVGHGTKRAIGRPAQTNLTLDLSGLSGVILYEPEELVLSAQAGTPLDEIEALLGGRGNGNLLRRLGRCASAGCGYPAHRAWCGDGPLAHRVAARGRGAFGRAPQGHADRRLQGVCDNVRRRRSVRCGSLAHPLAGD